MGEDTAITGFLSIGVTVGAYTYYSSVSIDSVNANTIGNGASVMIETLQSALN